MSDTTLPPCGAEHDLLFGVLALQLDFLSPSDLRPALQAWTADKRQSLPALLARRGVLSAARVPLLNALLLEVVAQHDGDPSLALASLCARREIPLNVKALDALPACGEIATLPAEPLTLPGPPLPAPAPSPRPAPSRFRVVRPHARGGLGEVFVAIDDELRREVALKEMQPPYSADASCRARFLAEAEITGELEHPGIVPVYGLGVHPDGRPFYAMRFIRGESLHDAITRFHAPGESLAACALPLRRLLARFVSVCETIAYAHSRGVVHRDIKPANIMLGPYGETLVVDWGLAKALGRPMTDDSCALPILPVPPRSGTGTVLGRAVGTPAYMPPEQAAGKLDQVGPASDIYALGATLFHLLTGQLPVNGATGKAVLEKVRNGEIVPPRKLRRDVPRPLEAVVLKAMALSPSDRYASAHEMAREVERWLADEPVIAHREAAWEKATRWMRRHRPVVAGVAVLLVTVLLALALGLRAVGQEQVRTARQRDAAQKNLEQAEANLLRAREAVDQCFVLASREPLLQQERMKPVRVLLLAKALPFYEGFQSQKPEDESLHIGMGENLFRVAHILAELNRKEEALQRYEQARQVFARLRDHAALARVWHDMGKVRHDLDQLKQARAAYTEALSIRHELAASGDPGACLELAETLNNLGALEQQEGHQAAARRHLEEATRLAAPLAPTNAAALRALGATSHNLGRMLNAAGDPTASLAAFKEAAKARRKLVEESRRSRPMSELASTLAHLADLHARAHHPDEAVKAYREASDLLRDVLATNQPDELADLASIDDQMGSLLRQQNKVTEATAAHERAIERQQRLVKAHPASLRYRRDLAGTHVNMGHLKRDSGQSLEALEWYGKALVGLGEDAPSLRLKAFWGRAEARGKLGRHPEATRDWEAAARLAKGTDQRYFQVQRAYSLARAGEYTAALKATGEMEKGSLPGETLYELACVCGLARQGARGTPAAAEKCAAQAMSYLRRAKQAGFFDKEKAAHARQDKDLASLKGRKDFDEFMAGLP